MSWERVEARRAIEQDRWAFQTMHEALRADREVVLAAVGRNGSMLEFASEELRGDEEVVVAAFRQRTRALRFASMALRSSKDFMLKVIRHHWDAWHSLPNSLKVDRDLLLEAVQQNGYLLGFVECPTLRADRDIVLAAVKNTVEAVNYYVSIEEPNPPAHFFQDREIALELASQSPVRFFPDVGTGLRADKDFVLMVARRCLAPSVDAAFFYEQAAEPVRQDVTLKEFEDACDSPIAVLGQEAPTHKLLLLTFAGLNYFNCQVRLESTDILTFSISEAAPEGARPPLLLRDLARVLLEQVNAKVSGRRKPPFFLKISASISLVGAEKLGAWDGARPLLELAAPSSGDFADYFADYWAGPKCHGPGAPGSLGAAPVGARAAAAAAGA